MIFYDCTYLKKDMHLSEMCNMSVSGHKKGTLTSVTHYVYILPPFSVRTSPFFFLYSLIYCIYINAKDTPLMCVQTLLKCIFVLWILEK